MPPKHRLGSGRHLAPRPPAKLPPTAAQPASSFHDDICLEVGYARQKALDDLRGVGPRPKKQTTTPLSYMVIYILSMTIH
jgi:hypothetical protein